MTGTATNTTPLRGASIDRAHDAARQLRRTRQTLTEAWQTGHIFTHLLYVVLRDIQSALLILDRPCRSMPVPNPTGSTAHEARPL